MPLESGKAYHLQIGIYLRAVINNLKRFTVKRCALVAPQPLGIHVGKQAAKRASYKPLQRQLFKPCQSRVAVSEYPVHGTALLIEYHLNIRKRKGQIFKAAVMTEVFLIRYGYAGMAEAADNTLLLCMKLLNNLVFLSQRVC